MTRVLPALVVLLALAPSASAATRARPDLVAKSVKGQPKTLIPGTRFTVKVTVRNSGKRRAGRSTLAVFLTRGTRFSRGALSIGHVRVPALRPRKSKTMRVKAKLPAVKASARALPQGNYRLLACVDTTHKVRERNEKNDCRAQSRTVIRLSLPTPAPQPSAPSPSPPASGPGAPAFAMSDGFDWGRFEDSAGDAAQIDEPIPITLRAANGLPGAAGYTRSSAAHEDLPAGTTTAVPVSETDDGIANVALPFNFDFAGIPYDSVSVSTNGWLSFDSPAWDFYDDGQPDDFRGVDAIVGRFYRGLMPYWDDLDLRSGAAIADPSLTETVAPGNASVTFAWNTGQCCFGAGPVRNFSATLFPDGSFRYDYGSPNDSGGFPAFVGYGAGDGSLDSFAANTKSVPSTSLLYTPKPLPAAGTLAAGTLTASIPRGTVAGALDPGCAVATAATPLQDGQISCAVPALAPGQSLVRHVSWAESADEMSDAVPTRDYSGAYTPGASAPLTNEDELTVASSFLPDRTTSTNVSYTGDDPPQAGSPTTFQVHPNINASFPLLNPSVTIQLPENATFDSIKVDGLTDDYPACEPPTGGSVTCLLPTVANLKVLDVTVTPTAAAEGNVLTLSAGTNGDNVTSVTAGSASSSGTVTG